MISVRLLGVMLLVVAATSCTIQSCVRCSPDADVCLACGNGHQLTLLGNCVPETVANCAVYMNPGECLQCYPSYNLTNNQCQKQFSGCLSFIETNICKRCFPELTNINGICTGTLNCQRYVGSSCATCFEGFSLVGNLCTAFPANCAKIDSANGVCLECAQGHLMVGYRCISSGIKVPDCVLYNGVGKCFYCKKGYLMDNGVCLAQIGGTSASAVSSTPPRVSIVSPPSQPQQPTPQTNPNQPTSAGSVGPRPNTLPPPRTSPISSSPTSGNNLNTVLNRLNVQCSQFKNKTQICISCYPSYFLDVDGICKLINTLCRVFDHQLRRCAGCYTGYKLSQTFNCLVAPPIIRDPRCKVFDHNTCTECFGTFHLKNGVCERNNPLCKQINPDGSCVSCFQGYFRDDGNCVKLSSSSDPFCITSVGNICSLCVNGYFVHQPSGRCIPTNLNCTQNNNQGQCTLCQHNFLLIGGNCVVPIAKCVEYRADGKCAGCESGFFLSQKTYGICYPKDITCRSYDQNGNCQACINTYHLFKGTCIFPSFGYDPLCDQYQNSYCIACLPGNYLLNYRCQIIDPNCIDFNIKTNTCNSCTQGMTAQGTSCL